MKIAGIAAFAASVLLSSAVQAATFDVTVWTGPNNGVDSKIFADNVTPTGLSSAHFTWSGDIDWLVGGDQNVDPTGNHVDDFLGDTSKVSNFSSANGAYADLNTFLNASLSVAGDAYASYFQIVGFGGGHGSITHDDGASIYDYLGNAVYSSPNETSAITGNFDLPTGAHPFTVYYVEGNGSPSVLKITGLAVPEPATWAMMLMGFGGLGAVMRRRRANAAVAFA